MAVSVVAIGARTPVGLCADASGAAVRAGLTRLSLHPFMIDRTGNPVTLARDGALEVKVPLADRCAEMGAAALEEACEPLRGRGKAKAALYVALPEERPGSPVRTRAT